MHLRGNSSKFPWELDFFIAQNLDQKRGKPLASDMGKDSAAVERSGAAN